MVRLATQLLSEQIQPVRITSISDAGGEPQGEFVSNQMRFRFRFTKAGQVTYQPKTTKEPDRGDAMDEAQARIDRLKASLAGR